MSDDVEMLILQWLTGIEAGTVSSPKVPQVQLAQFALVYMFINRTILFYISRTNTPSKKNLSLASLLATKNKATVCQGLGSKLVLLRYNVGSF